MSALGRAPAGCIRAMIQAQSAACAELKCNSTCSAGVHCGCTRSLTPFGTRVSAAGRSPCTGYRVLATVQTNDAISSVTRPVDIAVGPFLRSSSLLGATAQRLVRKLCPLCPLCPLCKAQDAAGPKPVRTGMTLLKEVIRMTGD